MDTFYDLVTTDDIAEEALEGVQVDIGDLVKARTVQRLISDISARVEMYLDRPLIVREIQQDTSNVSGAAFASAWPVVQALAGCNVVPRSASLIEVRGSVAQYIAGYRRESQSLQDLQVRLPLLTTLPALLPADIRGVCVRLVLNRLIQRLQGEGRISKEVAVGSGLIRTQGTERDFEMRILETIFHHRRV